MDEISFLKLFSVFNLHLLFLLNTKRKKPTCVVSEELKQTTDHDLTAFSVSILFKNYVSKLEYNYNTFL
jgi:hypothetical protein